MSPIKSSCLVLALAGSSLAAFADVGQWKIDTSATAAETTFDGAAAWFDANNWDNNGFIPERAGDVAQFYKSGENWTSSGLRYTSVDRDFTIGGIIRSYKGSQSRKTWTANKRVLLAGDHTITLENSGASTLYGLTIFGRVLFGAIVGQARVSHVDFCGPVDNEMGKAFQFVGTSRDTEIRFRRDLWADSSGPAMTNLAPTVYAVDEAVGFVEFVAPHGSDGLTGSWDTVEGSAILRLASGADKHVLTAGATVEGDGIPDGAFVKRIYTDSIIEISAPATATASGVELTFGDYRAQMYQRIDSYSTTYHKSLYNVGFMPLKYRAEDECIVEIMDLGKTQVYNLFFDVDDCLPGLIPGRVVLRNTSAFDCKMTLGTCEVEFAMPTNGTPAGFPNQVQMNAADRVAKLVVGDGLTASVGGFTNIVGTLVKTGAGTLTTRLCGEAFRMGAEVGSLTVEAGVLEVTESAAAEVVMDKLTLKAGAMLVLPDGDLRCEEACLEPGATLRFNGRLFVPRGTVIPDGVVSDGITVVHPVPSDEIVSTDSFLHSVEAEAGVVGEPAHWFDASDKDSFVFAEDGKGYTVTPPVANYPCVLAWKDVRGDDYQYATCNWANATSPRVQTVYTNAEGRTTHVRIPTCSSDAAANQVYLKWQTRTMGIRSLFKVMSTAIGGGSLLGGTNPVRARQRYKSGYGEPIFESAPPSWTNTPIYVNGEARDWRKGYPYQRGTDKLPSMDMPVLVEFHPPTDDWNAQNFGYQSRDGGRSGGQLIYECLIYTNVLTAAEKLAVRKYLMRKWCPEADVPDHSTELDDFDKAFEIGAGEHVDVRSEKAVYASVSGAGFIAKHGSGELQIEEIDGDDLTVVEGKLSLKSVGLPTAADVGVPYVHVDASDESSFTEMSGTTVRGWRDTRGEGFLTATAVATTKGPTLVLDETLGKNVVDFGAAAQCRNTSLAANATSLAYQTTSNAHTVVQLINTAGGGGVAFFGDSEYGMAYTAGKLLHGGFYRVNFQAKDPYPISEPSFPMLDGGTYFSSSGYFVAGCTNGVPGGIWARQNGAYVEPKCTGFKGEWELVSLVDPEPVLAGGFAQMPYDKEYSVCGGFKIAESLVYTNVLTRAEVKRAEAYLRYKWYGETTPGERPAVAGALSVSEGAELEVWGGAPLSVSAMSVAGTVSGALALREGGVIEVVVKEDGTVDPLAISDGVTLPATGTVKLVGAVGNLVKGAYPLFETDATGLSDGWAVDLGDATVKCSLALRVVDGRLVLDVTSLGMLLIVR